MDLSTSYMGLTLKHPVVPSASPLSYDLDRLRRLEDAGASAIVMHSLFEEQIVQESQALEHFLSYGTESYAEALSYFPEPHDYNVGPDEYLALIRSAKAALDIPIIGSLNGTSPGGWTRYAQLIEEAGADALELNLYTIPTDPNVSGGEVEKAYLEVMRDVRENIAIPIAVKLSPYFSATANMALRLSRAGAKALVLFNRFYQPDFDLDRLEVVPQLVLSQPHELTLPLRWVAILYGRVPVDFAISSGVHSHLDVLKGLMAGAKVTMTASELLKNGVGRIPEILAAMEEWMDERGYASVRQLQGSMSQRHVGEPTAFERANYMKMLQSWQPEPPGRLL
jgi:dihydroorotate dehydrogenase (fumarate)